MTCSAFNNTYFDGAKINSAEFRDSKFVNSTLINAEIISSKFLGAEFPLSNFNGAKLNDTQLVAADLRGVKLNNTDLSNTNLYFANLDDYHKVVRGQNNYDTGSLETRKFETIYTEFCNIIYTNTDFSSIKISENGIRNLPDEVKNKYEETFNTSLHRSNLFSKTITFKKGYALR